ncbi:MAG: phosphoethanolamine transferase CptA [DPANN group archaeon]|nr:phosphoethanolamine transferase CptA [DPANN group archaeon]
MTFYFSTLLGNLNEVGFYDFFLPFVLFTTLTYALFRKIKLFDEGVALDAMFAMSIGFFIINYSTLGIYLSHLFSVAGVFIALLVAIVLITATLGVDLPTYMSEQQGTAIALVVLIAVFVLLESDIGNFLGNIDGIIIKVIILITVLIAMMTLMAKKVVT